MYLKTIMENYLNEAISEDIDEVKPIVVNKSEWIVEDKKLSKVYKFSDRRFLESFVIEILKYKRKANASIELRTHEDKVGIILHALTYQITEIELDAKSEIDKIKKDVMYYYEKQDVKRSRDKKQQ